MWKEGFVEVVDEDGVNSGASEPTLFQGLSRDIDSLGVCLCFNFDEDSGLYDHHLPSPIDIPRSLGRCSIS